MYSPLGTYILKRILKICGKIFGQIFLQPPGAVDRELLFFLNKASSLESFALFV